MTEFSDQVAFIRLFPQGHQDYAKVLWPCVLFDNKEDFCVSHGRLTALTGHNNEISKKAQDEILSLHVPINSATDATVDSTVDATPDDTIDATPDDTIDAKPDDTVDDTVDATVDVDRPKVAYLLGGVKYTLRQNRLRVVQLDNTSSFKKGKEEAMNNFSSHQGFKEAYKEAVKLHFGPEFSRSRLCCQRFNYHPGAPDIMWPCLLFDDPFVLTDGLRQKNILSPGGDYKICQQFISVTRSNVLDLPPYIYVFGTDEYVSQRIDSFCLESQEDFRTVIGDALMDNNANVGFKIALEQAMAAISDVSAATNAGIATMSGPGPTATTMACVQQPVVNAPVAVAQANQEDETGSLVNGLPTVDGELRVDFGQKECPKCCNVRRRDIIHDTTCLKAREYVAPSKKLLELLDEEQFREKLNEKTRSKIKNLNLFRHIVKFRVNKRRKNNPGNVRERQAPRRRGATNATTIHIKEET